MLKSRKASRTLALGTDWPRVSLDRLYDFASGLSKPAEAFGSGHPFLAFLDVYNNIFVPKVLKELVDTAPDERIKYGIRRGDVFLTRTSESTTDLGMSSVALEDVPDATFNGFTKRLRPKAQGPVDPVFAAYFFRSSDFRRQVTAMASLSTRASLNNDMLARLTMPVPPHESQVRIGTLLRAFDDAAAAHHAIATSEEALGRTLFSSLFVAHGPARAGNWKGGPLAPDFLTHLVSGELGDVPDRWSSGTLGDIVERRTERVGARAAVVLSAVASGALVRSDDFFRKRVYSADISNYLSVHQGDFAYNPSRINLGSIGMLKDDILGAVSPVYVVLTPHPGYGWFLEFALRTPGIKSWIQALSSGTVRQSLAFDGLAAIPCVIPPRHVVAAFEKVWLDLNRSLQAHRTEGTQLTGIRREVAERFLGTAIGRSPAHDQTNLLP
jgi:hypothetical protein